MVYAVIAAGQGSRLASEGVCLPKPLVDVGGEPLIGRMVRLMARQPDCERIEIVVNSHSREVEVYLASLAGEFPLHVTVRDTPGSLHTLAALVPMLGDGDACVSTVDAVCLEEEFDSYLEARRLSSRESDAFMAVTRYVDDEKPLYVAADSDGRITGYFDTPSDGADYVSGGMYILSREAREYVDLCIEGGQTRMRDFQRSLVGAGLRVRAYEFIKIIDVDHAADIAVAEQLTKK